MRSDAFESRGSGRPHGRPNRGAFARTNGPARDSPLGQLRVYPYAAACKLPRLADRSRRDSTKQPLDGFSKSKIAPIQAIANAPRPAVDQLVPSLRPILELRRTARGVCQASLGQRAGA